MVSVSKDDYYKEKDNKKQKQLVQVEYLLFVLIILLSSLYILFEAKYVLTLQSIIFFICAYLRYKLFQQTSQNECMALVDPFSILLRGYGFLQFLTLGLHLDFNVEMSNSELLWSFWAGCVVVCAIIIMVLLMLLSKIYQKAFDKSNQPIQNCEIFGLLWILLQISVLVTTFAILALSLPLSQNVDVKQMDFEQKMQQISIIVLNSGIILVLILYIYFLRKQLRSFLYLIMGKSDLDNDSDINLPTLQTEQNFENNNNQMYQQQQGNNDNNNNGQNQRKKKQPKELKVKKMKIPKYLKQFSSTYFGNIIKKKNQVKQEQLEQKQKERKNNKSKNKIRSCQSIEITTKNHLNLTNNQNSIIIESQNECQSNNNQSFSFDHKIKPNKPHHFQKSKKQGSLGHNNLNKNSQYTRNTLNTAATLNSFNTNASLILQNSRNMQSFSQNKFALNTETFEIKNTQQLETNQSQDMKNDKFIGNYDQNHFVPKKSIKKHNNSPVNKNNMNYDRLNSKNKFQKFINVSNQQSILSNDNTKNKLQFQQSIEMTLDGTHNNLQYTLNNINNIQQHNDKTSIDLENLQYEKYDNQQKQQQLSNNTIQPSLQDQIYQLKQANKNNIYQSNQQQTDRSQVSQLLNSVDGLNSRYNLNYNHKKSENVDYGELNHSLNQEQIKMRNRRSLNSKYSFDVENKQGVINSYSERHINFDNDFNIKNMENQNKIVTNLIQSQMVTDQGSNDISFENNIHKDNQNFENQEKNTSFNEIKISDEKQQQQLQQNENLEDFNEEQIKETIFDSVPEDLATQHFKINPFKSNNFYNLDIEDNNQSFNENSKISNNIYMNDNLDKSNIIEVKQNQQDEEIKNNDSENYNQQDQSEDIQNEQNLKEIANQLKVSFKQNNMEQNLEQDEQLQNQYDNNEYQDQNNYQISIQGIQQQDVQQQGQYFNQYQQQLLTQQQIQQQEYLQSQQDMQFSGPQHYLHNQNSIQEENSSMQQSDTNQLDNTVYEGYYTNQKHLKIKKNNKNNNIQQNNYNDNDDNNNNENDNSDSLSEQQQSNRYNQQQNNDNKETLKVDQEQLDKFENQSNNNWDSEQNCLICFSEKQNCVLMKCGHGGLCYECAISLWKKKGDCFLCRQEIFEVYQVKQDKKNPSYYKILSITSDIQNKKEKKKDSVNQSRNRNRQRQNNISSQSVSIVQITQTDSQNTTPNQGQNVVSNSLVNNDNNNFNDNNSFGQNNQQNQNTGNNNQQQFNSNDINELQQQQQTNYNINNQQQYSFNNQNTQVDFNNGRDVSFDNLENIDDEHNNDQENQDN